MSVRVERLTKSYVAHHLRSRDEKLTALQDLVLDVSDGELLVVVGPSGSGKSTLLRCVAGLEAIDSGRVWVGGRDVTEVEPGARDVSMVFQEYALFPHMTVAENISFGLRARKVAEAEIERRLDHAAAVLSLAETLDRVPSELSGGERQRVALARAIVRAPKVFLLDEPLSNLDAELRARTRAEIKQLQRELGTTMIYVTHDQVEATTMGDRIAILRGGRLEQIGPPQDVYRAPATGFVARFLGMPPMNLFPAGVLGGSDGWYGVRPEHVSLTHPSDGRLTGDVVAVEPLGSEGLVHVTAGGARIVVRRAWDAVPRDGDRVGLSFSDGDLHRFEDRDGRALS
jgi:multiple sugar transport system ATP-binding protein